MFRSISAFRNAPGYDALSRAIGGAWFLGLAVLLIHGGYPGPVAGHDGSLAQLLTHFAITGFYLSLWLLLIIRPPSLNRAGGLVPSAVAMAGTYLPWLMVLLPAHHLSHGWYAIATTMILAGNVMTLTFVWYLGRSFSLVPQARKLVTTGPYAVIRHPLYLAEGMMTLGAGLLYLSPLAVTLLVAYTLIQIRRMFYEEALLSRIFPEYAAYMGVTWRVLPGIW